jgi:hypothetical protein
VEAAVEVALVGHAAALVLAHVAACRGEIATEVAGSQEGTGDHLCIVEGALGSHFFARSLQVIIYKTVNCDREVIHGGAR